MVVVALISVLPGTASADAPIAEPGAAAAPTERPYQLDFALSRFIVVSDLFSDVDAGEGALHEIRLGLPDWPRGAWARTRLGLELGHVRGVRLRSDQLSAFKLNDYLGDYDSDVGTLSTHSVNQYRADVTSTWLAVALRSDLFAGLPFDFELGVGIGAAFTTTRSRWNCAVCDGAGPPGDRGSSSTLNLMGWFRTRIGWQFEHWRIGADLGVYVFDRGRQPVGTALTLGLTAGFPF